MLVRAAIPQDAGAIARVHVDSWRSTYHGIIRDRILDGLSYETREANWRSALTEGRARNFIHVAEDDTGRVVGFVAAGREREGGEDYDAEIMAIYVRREFHGQGYGRELMLRSAENLERLGMRSVMLWVLAENPSRGFYERLGGKPLAEKQITIEGDTLTEVAYGWPDLRDLLSQAVPADETGSESSRG